MPTYEYKCKSCSKLSEFFQSMTAKPIRKCPHCGKNALERQIGTGAAIVFKGSGFYQTDYRSESYKKAAESDKAPSSATPGSSTDSASSKPAADSALKSDAAKPVESKAAPAAVSQPVKSKSSSVKSAKGRR